MPTIAKPQQLRALLTRLMALRPNDQARWGSMTPHQAICHIHDSNLNSVSSSNPWMS